jgi:hypothetical protein
MAAKDMSVVLAHGAWADGPSWAPVVTALKAEGKKVSAVPLPLASLADDIAVLVVREAIRAATPQPASDGSLRGRNRGVIAPHPITA